VAVPATRSAGKVIVNLIVDGVLIVQVIIVTHGAFAHFLTEDWDVEDPMIGTAYRNCSSPET
jgi:hypothetical protein